MNVIVDVIGQKMKLATNLKVYAAKSHNFVSFEFNCTSDWDGMPRRALITNEQNDDKIYLNVNEDNRVYLPHDLEPGLCHMMLYGIKAKDGIDASDIFEGEGDISNDLVAVVATTNRIDFWIEENYYIDGVETSETPTSDYQNIIAALQAIVSDINRIDDKIGNLSGTVAGNIERIDAKIGDFDGTVQDNIERIDDNIDEIEANIEDIVDNIDDIEDNIGNTDNITGTIVENINRIDDNIDDIEDNIGNTNNITGTIVENINRIDSKIGDFNGTVEELIDDRIPDPNGLEDVVLVSGDTESNDLGTKWTSTKNIKNASVRRNSDMFKKEIAQVAQSYYYNRGSQKAGTNDADDDDNYFSYASDCTWMEAAFYENIEAEDHISDAIDCSSYIGLVLRGIPFHKSPYTEPRRLAFEEWGTNYGDHGFREDMSPTNLLLMAPSANGLLGAPGDTTNEGQINKDPEDTEGGESVPDDGTDNGYGGDSGNNPLSDKIHYINSEDYSWAMDPSAYKYKKSLRSYIYTDGEKDPISEDDDATPVRTASQLGNWMHDMGWEIDYSDTFEEVDVGDIVFWAKTYFNEEENSDNLDGYQNIDYREKTRYRHISHVGICISVTEIKDFDATNNYTIGNYYYLNVDGHAKGAYRVSGISISDPTAENDKTIFNGFEDVFDHSEYIMDIRYRHTIAEVTGFSPYYDDNGNLIRPHESRVVFNTTLEKKDPKHVCMIARPDLGSMTSGEYSGNVSSKEDRTNIDKLYKPGTYYLTNSIKGTLPAILRKIYWKKNSTDTNNYHWVLGDISDSEGNDYNGVRIADKNITGTGYTLEVKNTLRNNGQIYSIIQTLYETNHPDQDVYTRTMYCFGKTLSYDETEDGKTITKSVTYMKHPEDELAEWGEWRRDSESFIKAFAKMNGLLIPGKTYSEGNGYRWDGDTVPPDEDIYGNQIQLYNDNVIGHYNIATSASYGNDDIVTVGFLNGVLQGSTPGTTVTYITNSALSYALNSYVRNSDLDSKVSDLGYAKTSELSSYVETTSLNSTLNNYLTKTDAVSFPFYAHKDIPDNADLNDAEYWIPGVYNIKTKDSAHTIKNLPLVDGYGLGGILYVTSLGGEGHSYRRQIYMPRDQYSVILIRGGHYNNNTIEIMYYGSAGSTGSMDRTKSGWRSIDMHDYTGTVTQS